MKQKASSATAFKNSLRIQYSDKATWISALSRDQSLSCSERIVGIVLCDYFNIHTGEAWPSIARLVDEAGVSKRTVIRALKKLEGSGYMRANRSRGRGKNNLYTFSQLYRCEQTEVQKGDSVDTPTNCRANGTAPNNECGDINDSKRCQTERRIGDTTAPLNKETYTNKEIKTSSEAGFDVRKAALEILLKNAIFIEESDPRFAEILRSQESRGKVKPSSEFQGRKGVWVANEQEKQLRR